MYTNTIQDDEDYFSRCSSTRSNENNDQEQSAPALTIFRRAIIAHVLTIEVLCIVSVLLIARLIMRAPFATFRSLSSSCKVSSLLLQIGSLC